MLRLLLLIAGLLVVGCASGSGNVQRAGAPAPSPGTFEAVVVGTIHRSHLVEPGYSLSQLAALIEGYKPDLVLVEIRPEPFRQGHLEDGPFEMTYVTWLAQSQGIVVQPIDWFRDDEVGRDAEPDPGAQPAFERELKALEPRMKWPLTFEEAHSPEQDATLLMTLNLQARYLGGNGTWNQRQAWFHHQAIEAIRQRGAHRVMAFVGAFHRPELARHLAEQGGAIRNPRTIPLPRLGPGKVPEPVVKLWLDGVGRMKALAASAPGKLAESLLSKALYFQVAADRGGECCVDPRAFKAAPPAAP